jgi:GTP-sensing pleiotropic transcriptional regulator CodY
VRFYAGVPLIEPGGMALGTLCVIDRKPRKLDKRQRLQLEDLAQSVVGLILMRILRSEMNEYRRARAENDQACSRLKNHAEQLKRLAKGIRTVA